MKFRLALLSAAIVAAPVGAQSLSDTHSLRWHPSGKVPAASFHPVKRACSETAGTAHISGKTPVFVRQSCRDSAIDTARNEKSQRTPAAALPSAS